MGADDKDGGHAPSTSSKGACCRARGGTARGDRPRVGSCTLGLTTQGGIRAPVKLRPGSAPLQGRFVHIPPVDPMANWDTSFGIPWWKDKKYYVSVVRACLG